MLIDWFTVVAQMVNFIILMALLKHFLYDRIIKAMDEREEKIHSRLLKAEALQQEAAQESELYRLKNQEIDQKRDQVLARVEAEAAHRREELVQNARNEIDLLRDRWRESLQKEQESFLQQLRLTAAGQVFAISRRALADLADSVIEKKVIDTFLARLEAMDGAKRQEAVKSIMKEGGLVVVRSAGKMSPVDRRKITAALHRLLDEDIKVEYETMPEMILGVELVSRGQKISWNLVDYLGRLETQVRETLETEEESHIQGKQKPAADRGSSA